MSPDGSAELIANVEAGRTGLPSASTIYKARSKLDWMCMLYQRRLWKRAVADKAQGWSQLPADASPQGGCEYFNLVEDQRLCCSQWGEGFGRFCRPLGWNGLGQISETCLLAPDTTRVGRASWRNVVLYAGRLRTLRQWRPKARL